MFTGIIQVLGQVESLKRQADLLRLGISASFAGKVKIGDSISVNGVCLTATKIEGPHSGAGNVMFFDAVSSTIKTTTISSLKLNDKVNLEQALKAGDKIGGHFVTGHVDAAGVIRKKTSSNDQAVFEISINAKFMNGIVDKCSIAVDGISLTVAEKKKDSFVVSVIPHTLKATTLGFKRPGDVVNIELDAMGKYSRQNASSKITEDYLREHGFLS